MDIEELEQMSAAELAKQVRKLEADLGRIRDVCLQRTSKSYCYHLAWASCHNAAEDLQEIQDCLDEVTDGEVSA